MRRLSPSYFAPGDMLLNGTPSTIAALRTALAAYSDVLDWLTTHDRCVYHGELR